MEEINSLIFHGCKLAKDLELNLQNLANQPNNLSKSCEDIIGIFSVARDRLNAQGSTSSYGQTREPEMAEHGVQDWLRYGTQAMGLLLAGGGERRDLGLELVPGRESGGFGGRRGEAQPMDVVDSGRGSAVQRPRRRQDEADKYTVMVAAPRMGNTEIPPEDGYTWRKYGQKEILGSRFPRGYYRCTHQKLYQCPAKKQVQRLDNDPFTFEVTYRGTHTCHMSSTAPSVPPISSELITTTTTTTHSPPPPPQLGTWLSMDISSTSEGATSAFAADPHGNIIYRRDFGGSSSGGAAGTSSGGAGPSTARYGRDVDFPVADLADAMFNSGSSSNNSIDLIFSEDKWGTGDKKS